jgi:hypothetical protein
MGSCVTLEFLCNTGQLVPLQVATGDRISLSAQTDPSRRTYKRQGKGCQLGSERYSSSKSGTAKPVSSSRLSCFFMGRCAWCEMASSHRPDAGKRTAGRSHNQHSPTPHPTTSMMAPDAELLAVLASSFWSEIFGFPSNVRGRSMLVHCWRFRSTLEECLVVEGASGCGKATV